MCVPGSGRYQATLIPDTAVGNDQNQRTVLVVGKDNKVSARRVELGALFGAMRSIVSGLNEEDVVIVNGQMHTRPGAVVKPIESAIKLDAQAFSDPGYSVARTIPATEVSPAISSLTGSMTHGPTTQSSFGN